jgi:hypothetical protein
MPRRWGDDCAGISKTIEKKSLAPHFPQGGGVAMTKRTVRLQNIKQFRLLLQNNPDAPEREVLESLLAEELAEDAAKAESPTLHAQGA